LSDVRDTTIEPCGLDPDELAAAVIDDELVDRLVAQADAEDLELLGEVRIAAPRDRVGSFDSKLVPKGRRRLEASTT
jgi:hypothetical protein